MRKAATVELDMTTRKELERLSRSRSVSVRLAERSRIVLLAARGLNNQEIGVELDITRQKAGRWRDRFVDHGLGGIEKDAPRSGRIPSISRRKRARIVKKTIEEKPSTATHWSRASMAAVTGVSESTVGRIWRDHGLKPSSGTNLQTVQRQALRREAGRRCRFVFEPTRKCHCLVLR